MDRSGSLWVALARSASLWLALARSASFWIFPVFNNTRCVLCRNIAFNRWKEIWKNDVIKVSIFNFHTVNNNNDNDKAGETVEYRLCGSVYTIYDLLVICPLGIC